MNTKLTHEKIKERWNWKKIQFNKSIHLKQIGIKIVCTKSKGGNNLRSALKFWKVRHKIQDGEREQRKKKKKDIGTNPRHIDHTHRNKMEWSLKQLKIAARGDDWSLDNFVSPIKKAWRVSTCRHVQLYYYYYYYYYY